MSPRTLAVGDTVQESPVGPGTITGFSERGFPMVNGITVARLISADGGVFDPYDTYASDAACARQEGGAA